MATWRRKIRGKHRPDYILGFAVLGLVIFGLIAVASASSVEAHNVFGDPYYHFKHQLSWGGVVGLGAMLLVSHIHFSRWKNVAGHFLIGAIVLLIVVFIPGIGTSYGTGASRWINIGSFSLQPTEIVKLMFVVYLAAWFAKREKDLKAFKKGLFPFLVALSIIAFLVILQPDLGTLVVIGLTSVIMFFVAGAPLIHVALIIVGASGALMFLIKMAPYRLARLTVFLNPELDPQGIGYQVNQALLAIGSGGLLGFGLGNSRQKFNYLPEPASDSIFAIIAEELGFFRASILIILFIIIAWRGYKIAREAPDMFSRLLATGITSWIVFQAWVNIGALLSLLPLTGIPLPFVSLGGTSLTFTLVGVGILLSISRYTKAVSSKKRPRKFQRQRLVTKRV